MTQRVRITHPYHPRTGQEHELVVTRYIGGEERACLEVSDGQVVWLPRRWTSLEAPDPFVELSAGRAAFRTWDLLEVARLLERLRALADPAGGPRDV